MEQHIIELEVKVMAAEDQIDELNRTVWRQAQMIDRLNEQLLALSSQIRTLQPADGGPAEDEIPPHW